MYYKVHMLHENPTSSSKPRDGGPSRQAFEDLLQFQCFGKTPDRRTGTEVSTSSSDRFPKWEPGGRPTVTRSAFHDRSPRLRPVVTFSRFCTRDDGDHTAKKIM